MKKNRQSNEGVSSLSEDFMMRESKSDEDFKNSMGKKFQDVMVEISEEENSDFDILNGLIEWILIIIRIITRLIGNNKRYKKEIVFSSSIFIKI